MTFRRSNVGATDFTNDRCHCGAFGRVLRMLQLLRTAPDHSLHSNSVSFRSRAAAVA